MGQGRMEAGRVWKESGKEFYIGRGFRLSESIWFQLIKNIIPLEVV